MSMSVFPFPYYFPYFIIKPRDIERFTHFSVQNLVENGLMGENLIAKCNLSKYSAKLSLIMKIQNFLSYFAE